MIKDFFRQFFTKKQLDAYGRLKYAVKLWWAGLRFDLFEQTYKVEGLEFEIPYHLTHRQFRGRFPLDMYEAEERRHLKNYLAPDSTVLELGACLGVVSCLINRLLTKPERHVAVEAHPELAQYTERNRLKNNCLFKVEHCIISDQKENSFFIHKLITGGSTHRQIGKKINVTGKTITELEAAHGLRFDTLIMDIEGGELAFFKHYKHDLSRFRKIFVELHPFENILTPEEAAECQQILVESGFRKLLHDDNFEIWENVN